MPSNTVSISCPEIPLENVLVFEDRAELKRRAKVDLQPGVNKLYIKNISGSLVRDSIRVDHFGNATIQEVFVTVDKAKIAELHTSIKNKQKEVDEMKDLLSTIKKKIEFLDKMGEDISRVFLPKEGGVTVTDELLSNVEKVFHFHNTKSTDAKTEARSISGKIGTAEEEIQKLTNQLDKLNDGGHFKTCVVVVHCNEGGAAELNLVYQVDDCGWTPSYDLSLDTCAEKEKLTLNYYALVRQHTEEDWVDTPLVLTTAQPCLGDEIPELGILEASFWKPLPPPKKLKENASNVDGLSSCSAIYGAAVKEKTLSTEFTIAHSATILGNNDEHKVTIGIVKLVPQLVHECVPSKSLSVFLRASAVNTSTLFFLPGIASVFIDNSFVSKTHLKNIAPDEKFSCSLGVDNGIQVKYKAAKKYHKEIQSCFFYKCSSTICEQLIELKNKKKRNVLLVVKEPIPGTTDEKIKIRVLSPSTITPFEESAQSTDDVFSLPREGAKMNSKNNVEWTVNLAGGKTQELSVKYATDYPNEEKIVVEEKV